MRSLLRSVAVFLLAVLTIAGASRAPGLAQVQDRRRSVLDYGAVPETLSIDNTGPFQKALDAAALAGGGIVTVPHGRFYFRGNLKVGDGVVLAGETHGPFDPMWNPKDKRQGPTLLCTAFGGKAFLELGSNSGVENLIVTYPEQVLANDPGAHGPKQYPPTLIANGTGHVSGVYFPNSYIGIKILSGRFHVEDSNIGAYKQDIVVDNSKDTNRISRVILSNYWDWGFTPLTAVDFWVLSNGTGITARKADGLQISDVLIFGRHTGILFEKSQFSAFPDGGVSGHGENINFDTVHHGIVATASEERVGFTFTNVLFGPYWDQPGHAVWLQAPDPNAPPRISIVGGSIRHQWATKPGGVDWAFRIDGGQLNVRNVIGYDLGPRL